jgi:Fe-S-cluster containining protein
VTVARADGRDGARPWYAEGLRFRCTACGHCCTGVPGHVWVEKHEIERMARALGLSTAKFVDRYVRRARGRLSLREKENGDCVLLGEDRRCTVYAVKPGNCSTFPFWPRLLESEASWAETAKDCEGIGQCDLYTREEVERIASGDPAPLLRKHAAARDAAAAAAGAPASAVPLPVVPAAAVPETAPPAADPLGEPDWDGALAALREIYADLDRALPTYRFTCSASGRCCDFDAHGHRLYATTIEAEHFFRNSPPERANENPRHCPAWGPDRLCRAREGRMLGCRTYFCGPYPNGTPEEVTERFFPRIKALHDRFRIPYLYRDIVDWARERRPAAP